METNNTTDLRFQHLSFAESVKEYYGKERDIYTTDDGFLIMIASDRVSAFDRILPKPIPFKGIILNKMAHYFYDQIRNNAPLWFIGSPHPRVLVGLACTPINVEVTRRAYLTGSLWSRYEKGDRTFGDYELPDGMKENQRLPHLMTMLTTTAEEGCDRDITIEEILEQRLCTSEEWKTIARYTDKLFDSGTRVADRRDLLLVDATYKFGIDPQGEIRLMNEAHTPNSSRYFYWKGYKERLEAGMPQKLLNKEFVHDWLKEHGFEGKKDEVIPPMSSRDIEEFKNRYFELYTIMTDTRIEFTEHIDDTNAIITRTRRMIGDQRRIRN